MKYAIGDLVIYNHGVWIVIERTQHATIEQVGNKHRLKTYDPYYKLISNVSPEIEVVERLLEPANQEAT